MNFVLAAGGTGGHMIPAHALAAELQEPRPRRAADHRRARRALSRPVRERAGAHPPRRAARRRADRLAEGGGLGAEGQGEAKRLYREHTPDAVVGFGGYPAFPSLLAASSPTHPDRAPRAECGDRPGQPAARRRSRGDRHRLRRDRPAEAAIPRARSVLVGNPVREEIARARRACRSRRSTRSRRSRSSSPAEARARRSSARSCPKGSACSSRRFAAGCRSSSNAAPTISSGSASNMPSSASPPS